MAWRNCGASLALVAEVNARWPNRDKASDGTIGDAAHATRTSDHNPFIIVDNIGVVRARDIDKDGIDAPWLAEYLRTLGAAGDRRLTGGGYVIFNRRITMPNWSGWRVYAGTNPHDHHVHVSFSLNRAGFDSTAGWGISGAPTPTAVEDDLPTPADLWGHPIPDEYTPKQGDTMPAFSVLGFTLARVTWALEEVKAVRGDVGTLTRLAQSQQAAIESLAQLAGQGGGSTAEQIKAAVAEALRDNVVQVQVAVAGRS